MNFTSPFYSLPSRNELKLWGFLIPLTISRYYHQQILIFTFVALEKELLETLGKGLVELFTFMYATQLGVNLGCHTIFFFSLSFFFHQHRVLADMKSTWTRIKKINTSRCDVIMCIYVRVVFYICGGRDHWHQFPSFLALFAMFCSSCSFFYLIFSSRVWWWKRRGKSEWFFNIHFQGNANIF